MYENPKIKKNLYKIYNMVQTRRMVKAAKKAAKKVSKTRARSYRRRAKSSPCRRKGPAVCRGTAGCKVASGRKRSFCRRAKSTRRVKRGGSHHPHRKQYGGGEGFGLFRRA